MFSRPFVAVFNEAIVAACLFVVCVCLRLLLAYARHMNFHIYADKPHTHKICLEREHIKLTCIDNL